MRRRAASLTLARLATCDLRRRSPRFDPWCRKPRTPLWRVLPHSCPASLLVTSLLPYLITSSFSHGQQRSRHRMDFLLLLLFVVVVASLARRLNVPYAIVLVIAGLLLSLVPGIPRVTLNPDLIFLAVLPPLIYSAAWFTSWRDFSYNIVSILFLAFGLVGFTVLGVAGTARRIRLARRLRSRCGRRRHRPHRRHHHCQAPRYPATHYRSAGREKALSTTLPACSLCNSPLPWWSMDKRLRPSLICFA